MNEREAGPAGGEAGWRGRARRQGEEGGERRDLLLPSLVRIHDVLVTTARAVPGATCCTGVCTAALWLNTALLSHEYTMTQFDLWNGAVITIIASTCAYCCCEKGFLFFFLNIW